MLTLFAMAHASTLDFTRFELSADASGVELAYTLAADDWLTVSEARRQGRTTALAVTLEAEGYHYTAVVPVNAAARHVTLSRRAWPLGAWGLVALRDTSDFGDVAAAGRKGRELRIQVQGGIEGARPINPPLSVDPIGAPPPLPVTALPAPDADDAIDDAPPDEAVDDTAPPEPVTDAPAPAPVDRSTPPSPAAVRAGCDASFATDEDRQACTAFLTGRSQALDELAACTAIARPRHQRGCIEAISQVARPSAALVEACSQGIGPNSDALGCVRAAVLHAVDPVPSIRSCTDHIEDPGDAVACVKRSARLTYPVEPLLQACSLGFPDDVFDCVARAARGTFDRSDLVSACTTAWMGADRTRCVSILAPARGDDAAGVVRACIKLYEHRDQRFECMERARAVPSEARILHCGELRRTDDQMACIGG